jgi:hypothetical protein
MALLIASYPGASQAGESGEAGALFLRIGMGGRASGMGDAFVAVAKDASAVYWNPAAMAAVLGTHMMFMHNEYLQSMRLEQVAITHETDLGTFGIGFSGLYMDEMDRYDNVPTSIPLGSFSAYDVAFAAGFARYILPNLTAGFAVKPIIEKIDEISAEGVAFDFGLYHISRIPGVKLAAVIANVGNPMKFETEEFALPRMVKLGGSFERRYPALRGRLLATFDVVIPNDGEAKQHLGAEFGYDRRLFLRGGYKAGYDSQGATFGAGIKHDRFLFDYAVLMISNDLGDSHRFSLSLQF